MDDSSAATEHSADTELDSGSGETMEEIAGEITALSGIGLLSIDRVWLFAEFPKCNHQSVMHSSPKARCSHWWVLCAPLQLSIDSIDYRFSQAMPNEASAQG